MKSIKTVKVKFETSLAGIREICAPYPAESITPAWLKNMPPYVDKAPHEKKPAIRDRANKTIKSCPGINDFLDTGYILPLWADLLVKYDCYSGEINLEFADERFTHHFHSWKQFEASPLKKQISPYKAVINLHSPWRLELKKGYSTAILHPYWSVADNAFTVLPGIVDHDSFNTLNIIIKWNILGKGEYLLERGTPLALIMPFKRDSFRLAIEENLPQRNDSPIAKDIEDFKMATFLKKYKKFFWSKKNYG